MHYAVDLKMQYVDKELLRSQCPVQEPKEAV